MSKRDLLYSEDFKLYQNDIIDQLETAIDNLNAMAIKPMFTQDHDLAMSFQRGAIRSIEAILNLPTTYLNDGTNSKDNLEKAERIHKRMLTTIRNIWTKSLKQEVKE